MAIKVPIVTHKDNPLATFWGRLGTVLSYFSPVLFFALLMAGLPVTGGHGIGMVFWAIGAIAITILYFVVVITFCTKQEQKALNNQKIKQDEEKADIYSKES